MEDLFKHSKMDELHCRHSWGSC